MDEDLQQDQNSGPASIEIPTFGISEEPKGRPSPKSAGVNIPTFGDAQEPSDIDWENMPKSEIASRAIAAAPRSAWNALKAIPEAVYNYQETGEGLKQLGQGIYSKAAGIMGAAQDPEEKEQKEAVLNAVMSPFSSVAGFKKAIATDPFSVVSLAAIPLTGGASGLGAAAETAGLATTAGKALSLGSKAAKIAAGIADPLTGVVGAGKFAAQNIADPALQKIASVASGIGPESLQQIYQAGKSADPAIKNGFNTFAKGQGNAVSLSQDMAKSLTQLRNESMDAWRTSKDGILAANTDVPFDPVLKSIQDARDTIGPRQTAFGSSAQAHAALDDLETEILARANSSPGSMQRSLGAFDQLKRSLYNDAKGMPPMTKTAYDTVRNGVSDAIGVAASTYPGLMHDYQALLDNLGDIRTTLGTKDNVAATAEIVKLIKAQNDVSENQLIAQLAKYDPTIPYKIAGAAVNQAAGHPSNWAQTLSAAQWAHLGFGLATMNPTHIGAALSGIATQKVIGSPSNVSKAAYTAGQVAGAAEPVFGSAYAKAAPYVQKSATSPLMSAQGELQRQQYKSGGRVSDKLVMAVDRAKKNINNDTKSLLGAHDTHVAQALEIANRNIEG
jgi:hypothetical protein